MSLKAGDKAPSFKLIDSDKNEVSLSNYAGKNLIIHFFPASFTGVCTTQLCTVRDAISMYHNDKCDVVAISVDLPFTLAKFKELQNLNFTLLSDFNKEGYKITDLFKLADACRIAFASGFLQVFQTTFDNEAEKS